MLFERERNLSAIHYVPSKECENALVFFGRMRKIDLVIAETLNSKHKKRKLWVNKDRVQPPPLAIGDYVWYIRPPESGDKLATKWIGPAMVTAREGENSYEIEVKHDFL